MTEQMNAAQDLAFQALMSALQNEVLTYEHLVAEIGLNELVVEFPREMWRLMHNQMAGLHIAPVVEVKDDNRGDGSYPSEAIRYLTKMVRTALDPEFKIMHYQDLVECIEPLRLVQRFPRQCWLALTRAMHGWDLAYDPTAAAPAGSDEAEEPDLQVDGTD